MPHKNFEFIDQLRAPGQDRDTGTYPVRHADFPKCLLYISDLSIRPPLDEGSYIFGRSYDQTDGEGSRYQYQVAITAIENETEPSSQALEELVEECWDWWLSYYLL